MHAIKELEYELSKVEGFAEKQAIQEKITKNKKELTKLQRLDEFYHYYRGSFFERLRTQYLRAFMELFAPLLIGVYTVILLFFFTPTPPISQNSVNYDQPSVRKSQCACKGRKTREV